MRGAVGHRRLSRRPSLAGPLAQRPVRARPRRQCYAAGHRTATVLIPRQMRPADAHRLRSVLTAPDGRFHGERQSHSDDPPAAPCPSQYPHRRRSRSPRLLLRPARPARSSQAGGAGGRGGFWLQVGDMQIHVGVEDDVDRAATRAHLASSWPVTTSPPGAPALPPTARQSWSRCPFLATADSSAATRSAIAVSTTRPAHSRPLTVAGGSHSARGGG